MKLPIAIAQKLICLQSGEKMPFSKLKHPAVDLMVDNGILKKLIQGRSKVQIFLPDPNALAAYLQNHFGIANLAKYIETYSKEDLTRSEAIEIASNSKLKPIRTFKGFLINCLEPVECTLNGKAITIKPELGTFTFIYDFESFLPPSNVMIVGIENPENFRFIEKQRKLFQTIQPLFVSRYPQSKDLIKWLQSIPNNYLHFGDFDFSGLNIYWNEYRRYLPDRTSFFMPSNVEELLSTKGNRDNYYKQTLQFDEKELKEENVITLLQIIRRHKKGLEQEAFLM